jgi:hypothetical protein
LLSGFKDLWPKPTRGFGSLVLWPKTPKTKEPKLGTRFRALVKANLQYYSPLAQISLAGMLGTLVKQANPTKATKASRGSG